jgi:hypothetical protein
MKTTETTQNQTVRTSPNMVAKMKADEKTALANKAKEAAQADIKQDATPEAKPVAKPAKKEPTVRAESNEAIGERLLKEKANEATILATFTKVYKTKSNITDKKFIQARANIYMKIAKKRAEAKAAAKKAS